MAIVKVSNSNPIWIFPFRLLCRKKIMHMPNFNCYSLTFIDVSHSYRNRSDAHAKLHKIYFTELCVCYNMHFYAQIYISFPKFIHTIIPVYLKHPINPIKTTYSYLQFHFKTIISALFSVRKLRISSVHFTFFHQNLLWSSDFTYFCFKFI